VSFERSNPIHVLIADDDPGVRSVVLDVVKDLGHVPTCATNGADAWRLFSQRGADVVVSDWMMPRMDGVELCRSVRAKAGAPYTYFILLTSLGDAEHRIAGMQAGADEYLPKPFDLGDMQATLIAAERVTALHRRREALLRQASRFAAETDPERLLHDLLREAIDLVGGTAGVVTRWDEQQQVLLPVGVSTDDIEPARLRLGEGASGRAAKERGPVVIQAATDSIPDPALDRVGLQSAVAVPLLHDARLVGTLAVGTDDSSKTFTQDDVDLLELQASNAAAALVAHERARLDGVLLAARTAQHELNNQLAVARGYAEMLVGSPDLPPHLAEMAEEVKHAADDAVQTVRQLRNISHVEEQHWSEPGDSTIDLAASS
jgi:CheY-like chemotaxis protein